MARGYIVLLSLLFIGAGIFVELSATPKINASSFQLIPSYVEKLMQWVPAGILGGSGVFFAFGGGFAGKKCSCFLMFLSLIVYLTSLTVIAAVNLADWGYFDPQFGAIWDNYMETTNVNVSCRAMAEHQCVGWSSVCQPLLPDSGTIIGLRSDVSPGLATGLRCPSKTQCAVPRYLQLQMNLNATSPPQSCKDPIIRAFRHFCRMVGVVGLMSCVLSAIIFALFLYVVREEKLNNKMKSGELGIEMVDSSGGPPELAMMANHQNVALMNLRNPQDWLAPKRGPSPSQWPSYLVLAIMILLAGIPVALYFLIPHESDTALPLIGLGVNAPPISVSSMSSCPIVRFFAKVKAGSKVHYDWVFSDGATLKNGGPNVSHQFGGNLGSCHGIHAKVTFTSPQDLHTYTVRVNVSRFVLDPSVYNVQTLSLTWSFHSCTDNLLMLKCNEGAQCSMNSSLKNSSLLVGLAPRLWQVQMNLTQAKSCYHFNHRVTSLSSKGSLLTVSIVKVSVTEAFLEADISINDLGSASQFGNRLIGPIRTTLSEKQQAMTHKKRPQEDRRSAREKETRSLKLLETSGFGIFDDVSVQPSLHIEGGGIKGVLSIDASGGPGRLKGDAYVGVSLPLHLHKTATTGWDIEVGISGEIGLQGEADLEIWSRTFQAKAEHEFYKKDILVGECFELLDACFLDVGIVVIAYTPYVALKGSFAAEIRTQLQIGGSFSSSASGTVALQYTSTNGFHPIGQFQGGMKGQWNGDQWKCDATLSFGLPITVGVEIYDIAKIDITTEPQINVEATGNSNSCPGLHISTDGVLDVKGKGSIRFFHDLEANFPLYTSSQYPLLSPPICLGKHSCAKHYKCNEKTWQCEEADITGHSQDECKAMCIDKQFKFASFGPTHSDTDDNTPITCVHAEDYTDILHPGTCYGPGSIRGFQCGSVMVKIESTTTYRITVYCDSSCQEYATSQTFKLGDCMRPASITCSSNYWGSSGCYWPDSGYIATLEKRS